MPRLILKCPYLKGSCNAAQRGNYLRYIATREEVELTQGEESLPGREGYLQYSADPSKGYLTKKGLEQTRSVLARDLFRQELTEISRRQSQRREDLVRESQTALQNAIQRMREGPFQSSNLEPLLLRLAEKLSATGGKKQ